MDIRDMIAVALTGVAVLLAERASGAPLTQEQATMIYALAHSTTGYKLPEKPPTIYLVTQDELRVMACPGKPCPVRAYSAGPDIYLDETLDMADVYGASILLHEIVHFLAFMNKGAASSCEEWVDREIEAYAIQNHVLEKVGAQPVMVPAFNCL